MVKKIILYGLLLISFIGLIFSAYKIICWYIDNQKTQEQIKNVEKFIEENSKDSTDNNMTIDFTSLIKENKETKGWIQIPNTNINYPFVQHKDNSYYLTHSFDNSYNNAGWIFLDYRNSIELLDTNTIIYGHGRVDGTMFGSLKNVLTEEWLNDFNNYKIRIYLPENTYTYEIFSAYHVNTTDDYLKTNFNSIEEYEEFLNLIKNRSTYSFPTNVTTNDKIITLSTCYNDKEKMVVHGKLIVED